MLQKAVTGLVALSNVVSGLVVSPREGHPAAATVIPKELIKRAGDPSDFSWVKRWAAIGDSYTAGIGAGAPLGRVFSDELEITLPDGKISGHGDWYCSRYNRAYPKLIEYQFGSHVEDFQFIACSGDRTEQIFQQAQHLKGDLDFVTLTAGGNDLCLAKMIQDCIMLPYFKKEACETVINKAQENIDSILKDNVRQILKELNKKVKKDGVVVLNAYAQFFDAENGDCEYESWDKFWMIPLRKLSFESLTKSRRERFNKLVLGINKALGEVVDEAAKDDDIGYKVGFAQWDAWVTDVDGHMCSSKSNGNYPDPNQPDMQFIKPDTHPWLGWSEDVKNELRRRDAQTLDDLAPEEQREYLQWEKEMKRRAEVYEASIYDSILYKSPAPAAGALHQLDRRAPAPPNCPGDGGGDWTFGLGMPDSVGRNVSIVAMSLLHESCC
jgi:lysophospholipase L1-like esterase